MSVSNPNISKHIEVTASLYDAGMRTDAFLAKKLTLSRAQISTLIKAGHVMASGKIIKPSQLVLGKETFLVVFPKKEGGKLSAQAIPLDVLFSDAHLIIINKPVGLVVHPGAGAKDNTLCNALLFHFPDMEVGNTERPGIVHRLDKGTSGIMVIAKTHMVHQKLGDDFKHRRIKKIYRAFCFGEIVETKFDLVTGHMRHPYNRLKFFTKIAAPKIPSANVRLAHTSFEVVSKAYGISQLKAILHTGRTHQIRAHLSDNDHPLLGDELYGGKRLLSKLVPDNLAHAIYKSSASCRIFGILSSNHQ
jgi:23S rRNA pseudouridine1911/1915/1917 synthase